MTIDVTISASDGHYVLDQYSVIYYLEADGTFVPDGEGKLSSRLKDFMQKNLNSSKNFIIDVELNEDGVYAQLTAYCNCSDKTSHASISNYLISDMCNMIDRTLMALKSLKKEVKP